MSKFTLVRGRHCVSSLQATPLGPLKSQTNRIYADTVTGNVQNARERSPQRKLIRLGIEEYEPSGRPTGVIGIASFSVVAISMLKT